MGVKRMQLFFFAAVAMTLASWPAATSAGGLPTTPYATHFHDCCMAAFSWPAKGAGGSDPRYAPVDVCEKDGMTLVSEQSRIGNKSGCEGGSMFVCSCMQPWIDTDDPTLAYGFAAYNIHDPDGTIESACYLSEFQEHDGNGKPMSIRKMILQNINTSQGILKGSFDMMLAGGGVGDYNKGCAAQWGSDWGQRYGGVDNEQACCKLPEGLRSSCLFRFKHLGENPPLAGTPQRVRCPVGIIDRSGSQRKDDAQVAVYKGTTDKTGQPAPDKYQRQRSVCANVDPLGIVSSTCGGSDGGSRLPKGYAKTRQDWEGQSPVDGQPPVVGQSPVDGQSPVVGQSPVARNAGHGAHHKHAQAQPAAQPGAPSDAQPGAQPGAQSAAQPDSQPGAQPDAPEGYCPTP